MNNKNDMPTIIELHSSIISVLRALIVFSPVLTKKQYESVFLINCHLTALKRRCTVHYSRQFYRFNIYNSTLSYDAAAARKQSFAEYMRIVRA